MALHVSRTIDIQASRHAVWDALTVNELISEWFGDAAALDVRVGGRGTLSWDGYGEFAVIVDVLDERSTFAFRWTQEPGTEVSVGTATTVRFTLEDRPGGTHLTVTETGWEDLDGIDIRSAMKENTEGWIEELDELRDFLEKQDSV
jgi:uncharacterized protein YndB with AHSA1/START domain